MNVLMVAGVHNTLRLIPFKVPFILLAMQQSTVLAPISTVHFK